MLPTDSVHYAHPAVGAFPMKPATFAPDDYHVDSSPIQNEHPAGTRGFVWQLVDKLDPEVARVEATLADGREVGNDTTDGYIALGGAGKLPVDAAWDKDYFTPVPLVSSLRFYDADGKLLGESTDGTAIAGYPSQRWVPGPTARPATVGTVKLLSSSRSTLVDPGPDRSGRWSRAVVPAPGWYVDSAPFVVRGALDRLVGGAGRRWPGPDRDLLRAGDEVGFWRVTSPTRDGWSSRPRSGRPAGSRSPPR